MRILFLLLAAVFAQSAAAQTAADPRWPEARGPLSLVDRMMNSTTISRSGGLFELRRKTAKLYTPAFSLGSREKVDLLTDRLRQSGYAVVSGPRTTGDGYYESCVVAIEGNQIELTV